LRLNLQSSIFNLNIDLHIVRCVDVKSMFKSKIEDS